jgi:N-methylhydantoinase A
MKRTAEKERLVLGVDTGGTFTDFVLQSDAGLQTFKLPSTPADPSRAIMKGLHHFFGNRLPKNLEIIHGSTVATNAFLERKGARTLLVTTHGFEDILFIGRQNRPNLYDFNITRPPEIISRDLVTGVRERMLFDGTVRQAPGRTVGKRLRALCRDKGIESVAVCFLHSYANDAHERFIGAELAPLHLPVTLSSEILPEFREYERLTTTLVNAYLGPVVSSYIKRLLQQIGGVSLHIQQSNGGVLPAADMEKRAVNTVLSGPAGGVHGAHQLAREMGRDRIITFDMGGTSTDVSLCDKIPTLTRDHVIDGYPIRIEVIDIHTVGAGGGSLAHVDSGGLLKVGPQSAGARPGPICYGVGGQQLTVTDANLFLGRLLPEKFMGGAMRLRKEKVDAAMTRLAGELQLDAVAAALGIIRIVNASMAKAIRAVSLERGYAPREFSLFAFGGASGLHCCELAGELAMGSIVIPARAGILSAQGMVFADPVLDSMQALFLRGEELDSPVLSEAMDTLVAKGLAEAEKLGRAEDPDRTAVTRFLNLRYQGQSYELSVPYGEDFQEHFHRVHEHNFGYRLDNTPLELISIQSSVMVRRPQRPLPRAKKKARCKAVPYTEQELFFGENPIRVPVFDRAEMVAGAILSGPALVADNYTTVLLPESFSLEVDALHNLVIAGEGS